MATFSTAALNNEITSGKASLKNPEIRNKTSILGRFNSSKEITSKSVTLLFIPDQIGFTPIKAKACAISSPPVLIVEVPQTEIPIEVGYSPLSCK